MKNSLKLRLLAFSICICVSCRIDNSDKQTTIAKTKTETKKGTSDYTIIFKERINPKENTLQRGVPPDVSHLYYTENLELNHIFPKDKEESDTIRLTSKNNELLVDLSFYQVNLFSYLLKGGDTLQVKYVEGLPQTKVINRQHPKFEFSYDSLRKNFFEINRAEVSPFFF